MRKVIIGILLLSMLVLSGCDITETYYTTYLEGKTLCCYAERTCFYATLYCSNGQTIERATNFIETDDVCETVTKPMVLSLESY